jgi:hypothetical protein
MFHLDHLMSRPSRSRPGASRLRVRRAAWALLVLLFGAASSPQVPADAQATLVLRILAFDRKLRERAQGTVKIAVVYREGDPSGDEIASALDSLAQKNSVSGMPVKAVRVPFAGAYRLDGDLSRAGVAAAYLCPAISKLAQAKGILTFTATRSYVNGGTSVALVRKEAKVGIVVHLANSRAEGADLDSGLLRIAEVVR